MQEVIYRPHEQHIFTIVDVIEPSACHTRAMRAQLGLILTCQLERAKQDVGADIRSQLGFRGGRR
mgnify:CR=1 FL=1